MRIGIDLGGTKIEAIAIGDDGRIGARRRIPTPPGDYLAVVGAIAELVASVEAAVGAKGTVGVAIPGTVSPATGVVKNANSAFLIGKPLDVDLTSALERPVRIANDANCFALSEAVDGAAAGARVVFAAIIGTGTGAGVVVDGSVLTGPNAIAGEWGHNPLPWRTDAERPGPPCYCGQSGCIETFLSGPGLARDYRQSGGEPVDAAAIASRAEAGEARAIATLERYEERMARALASIINVLDPDVIVLGGGLSNITRLYDTVPRLWGRFAFTDTLTTGLVRAKHGDSSGVRGAAWLWPKPGSRQPGEAPA